MHTNMSKKHPNEGNNTLLDPNFLESGEKLTLSFDVPMMKNTSQNEAKAWWMDRNNHFCFHHHGKW